MRHALISNDDGVFAPGLRALADAFLQGGWRVTVAAPDGERSAASHSITIKRPVVATQRQWDGVPDGAPLRVWALGGTPADCVKIALHMICEDPPDLVVSGINLGWNVGTDVHYSGTVGAAMEGAFEGVPGLAVSIKNPDAARYQNAADLAQRCARRLLAKPLPQPSVLNINLPDRDPQAIAGVVEAPLTQIRYTDAYDRMQNDRHMEAFWLKGAIIEEGCTPGGDLDMLVKGYATLTALGWDLTMHGKCTEILQDS